MEADAFKKRPRPEGGSTNPSLKSMMESIHEGTQNALNVLRQALESLTDFAPEFSALLQGLFGEEKEEGPKASVSSSTPSSAIPPTSPEVKENKNPPSPQLPETPKSYPTAPKVSPRASKSPPENSTHLSMSENHGLTRVINARYGSRVMKYAPAKEALKGISGLKKGEDLVKNNNKIEFKRSPSKAFERARQFAEKDGYDISVYSGYRSPNHQKGIKTKDEEKGRKGNDKWVSKAGESWHQSGGALDLYLHKRDSSERLTPISSSGMAHHKKESMDRLEKYMNRAGFVRYGPEPWHFEMGTEGWARIMQQEGYISPETPLESMIYQRDQPGKPSHHHHA